MENIVNSCSGAHEGSNVLPTIIISIISLFLSLAVAAFVFQQLLEYRKITYFEFYKIISRHHSKEITDLRRSVRSDEFKRALKTAIESKSSLYEVDKGKQLDASSVANYYEGLGMFLQNGWKIFPKEGRNLILEMLHNSVHNAWPIINENRKIINPNLPSDWASSFEWLYLKCEKYRNRKKLDV